MNSQNVISCCQVMQTWIHTITQIEPGLEVCWRFRKLKTDVQYDWSCGIAFIFIFKDLISTEHTAAHVSGKLEQLSGITSTICAPWQQQKRNESLSIDARGLILRVSNQWWLKNRLDSKRRLKTTSELTLLPELFVSSKNMHFAPIPFPEYTSSLPGPRELGLDSVSQRGLHW